MASQDEYLQRVAEADLTDEYLEILALVEKGLDLEKARQPEQAAQVYRQALRLVEATGAVAGARGHPLMGTRGTLLQFLGNLTRRGVKW